MCWYARAAYLGGFGFTGAGRALRSPTQVQMDGTHEGAVAAVSQGRHHQAGAVAQVLVPILHLSIHHAHRDAQVLRVTVQVLAAGQTVRQCNCRVQVTARQTGRQAEQSQRQMWVEHAGMVAAAAYLVHQTHDVQ